MIIPKVELLDDRVIIKPDEKNSQTKHGLYIPESSQKDMHQGTIVVVGDGLAHPRAKEITDAMSTISAACANAPYSMSEAVNRQISIIDKIIDSGIMKVAVGDKVVYGKFSGTELMIEGTEYVIMRQGDIKLKLTKNKE
jgi:chaperonin GroES